MKKRKSVVKTYNSRCNNIHEPKVVKTLTGMLREGATCLPLMLRSTKRSTKWNNRTIKANNLIVTKKRYFKVMGDRCDHELSLLDMLSPKKKLLWYCSTCMRVWEMSVSPKEEYQNGRIEKHTHNFEL